MPRYEASSAHRPHCWPRLSKEVMRTNGHVRRDDFVLIEEDAKGAGMSSEGQVAAFLPCL